MVTIYLGHEKTGEELEALCSEHPEQVEQLTKENLEILISWLIESQKTQAQQQLFKQCLTQLERFPEYEDDVDSAHLLQVLGQAAEQQTRKKRIRFSKRLLIGAAAVALCSVIPVVTMQVISDHNTMQFGFQKNGNVSVGFGEGESKNVASKESFLQEEDAKKFVPDVMLPTALPEGYQFESGSYATTSKFVTITILYSNQAEETIQMRMRWIFDPNDAESQESVAIEGKIQSVLTVDQTTYTISEKEETNLVSWNVVQGEKDMFYTITVPNSIPNPEEIAYSFQ